VISISKISISVDTGRRNGRTEEGLLITLTGAGTMSARASMFLIPWGELLYAIGSVG